MWRRRIGSDRAASFLLLERWIPGCVDPVRRLGGNVTTEAVLFVIGRRGFQGGPRIEPRPAPAFSPQRVTRVAVPAVLHHHEPAFQGLSVTDGPRRHRG